jgi:hypothetical protein
LVEVLTTLAQAGALTPEERNALVGLAYTRDRALALVFAQFAANKDGNAFRARLKELATLGGRPKREIGEIDGAEQRGGEGDEEEDEDNDEDEDEEEGEDEEEDIDRLVGTST